MTDNPAVIAAKLSDAQRKMVLSLSGDWTVRQMDYGTPMVWLDPAILQMATPPSLWTERLRLSPLGLAVRDHILKGAE